MEAITCARCLLTVWVRDAAEAVWWGRNHARITHQAVTSTTWHQAEGGYVTQPFPILRGQPETALDLGLEVVGAGA